MRTFLQINLFFIMLFSFVLSESTLSETKRESQMLRQAKDMIEKAMNKALGGVLKEGETLEILSEARLLELLKDIDKVSSEKKIKEKVKERINARIKEIKEEKLYVKNRRELRKEIELKGKLRKLKSNQKKLNKNPKLAEEDQLVDFIIDFSESVLKQTLEKTEKQLGQEMMARLSLSDPEGKVREEIERMWKKARVLSNQELTELSEEFVREWLATIKEHLATTKELAELKERGETESWQVQTRTVKLLRESWRLIVELVTARTKVEVVESVLIKREMGKKWEMLSDEELGELEAKLSEKVVKLEYDLQEKVVDYGKKEKGGIKEGQRQVLEKELRRQASEVSEFSGRWHVVLFIKEVKREEKK